MIRTIALIAAVLTASTTYGGDARAFQRFPGRVLAEVDTPAMKAVFTTQCLYVWHTRYGIDPDGTTRYDLRRNDKTLKLVDQLWMYRCDPYDPPGIVVPPAPGMIAITRPSNYHEHLMAWLWAGDVLRETQFLPDSPEFRFAAIVLSTVSDDLEAYNYAREYWPFVRFPIIHRPRLKR